MEQQNKLTEEEKAYQALRTQDMQDMPDLWSRIDNKAASSSEKEKNQTVCTGGSSNSDCDHCGAGRYQFDA